MNHFVRQSIAFIVLLLGFAFLASAQQQVYYYANATNGSYSFLAPNLTASTLATVGSWGSNTPCSNGGGISGLTVASAFSTFNPSNANSPALNVNITPSNGYQLQVTSISVAMRRSGTGPAKARLAYSVDGGTTWTNNGSDYVPNNGSCGSFNTVTWTLTTPLNVCQGMLKVRIYYFAPGASTGTCQTANLRVYGNVTPKLVPSIAISANPSAAFCFGTNATFTATAINGGTAPTYTWMLNGGVVGSNSSTYSNNSLVTGDVVSCELLSSLPCTPADGVESNAILMNVHQPVSSIVYDTICHNETYQFGTQLLTTSGQYAQTFTAANSCDSNVTLHLFIRPAINFVFADTICNAATYTWANQTHNSSGSYNQTFPSLTGCDSIVTLNLFVRPAINFAFADTVCSGSIYTWATQTHNSSGSYNQTFPSFTGCDSIVTLNLFVRPAINFSFADTVCSGAAYTWSAQTYTNSGSYNQTFPSFTGCDSVVTLNLFVRPAINFSFTDTVCNGAIYTWAAQTYTNSGSYNQTFPSFTGCDSIVTFNLFVRPAINFAFADTVCIGAIYTWATQTHNSSGSYNQTFTSFTGCDSIVTLNLFVRPAINFSFADTVCNGATYTWATQTYTNSGSYNQTFPSFTGCDSIVTLNLFVRPAINFAFADTVCNGATYTWAAQTYTNSASYNQTFLSYTGCDSIVTLHLFVRPAIDFSFADTVCNGESYIWATQTFISTGSYNQIFLSFTGCDSVVTLNLFVRPAISFSFADTVCSGAAYTWSAQTYTNSGSYNQTFPSFVGCDSVVTLNLFMRPANDFSFADTVCDGATYTWAAQTYTNSGSYNQTFPSFVGCDSVVTLNLFVRPAIIFSFPDTVCANESYNWGSQTYSLTGNYVQTFTAASGCDSMGSLMLFVRPPNTNAITHTICSGGNYNFGTQTLTVAGTYQHTFMDDSGCDSSVTLNLIVVPTIEHTISPIICFGTTYSWGAQTLATSGVYTQTFAAASFCDSIVTLNLTVSNLITDTLQASICDGQNYTFGGQTLNATGFYTQVFTANNGCDSLSNLVLTVLPLATNSINASVCFNENYTLGTQILNQSGSYVEVFQSSNGCDSTVNLNLLVGASPSSVTIDTTACGSLWFEGVAYFTSLILNDTLKNASGCDSLYRTINIHPISNDPTLVTMDLVGCETVLFEGTTYTNSLIKTDTFKSILGCDSSIRIVHITVSQASETALQYDLCEGAHYNFRGQRFTTSGVHQFLFKNQAGCDSMVVLTINVLQLPQLQVTTSEDKTYCVGDSVTIQALGAESYIWQYNNVEIGEGSSVNAMLFSVNNAFVLSGQDIQGCSDTLVVQIPAQPCCDLWMPNAFSPNGDGVNDVFKPEAKGHPNEYVMHIFNRWGATIYSSFKIAQGWDGTVNGKPVDIGDYYYRISGVCVNGEVINIKGTCTLIR